MIAADDIASIPNVAPSGSHPQSTWSVAGQTAHIAQWVENSFAHTPTVVVVTLDLWLALYGLPPCSAQTRLDKLREMSYGVVRRNAGGTAMIQSAVRIGSPHPSLWLAMELVVRTALGEVAYSAPTPNVEAVMRAPLLATSVPCDCSAQMSNGRPLVMSFSALI